MSPRFAASVPLISRSYLTISHEEKSLPYSTRQACKTFIQPPNQVFRDGTAIEAFDDVGVKYSLSGLLFDFVGQEESIF